jgi:hypothetical protein
MFSDAFKVNRKHEVKQGARNERQLPPALRIVVPPRWGFIGEEVMLVSRMQSRIVYSINSCFERLRRGVSKELQGVRANSKQGFKERNA